MHAYRHILCATDFSAASDRACRRAAELSGDMGASLTLLHVVENFPEHRSNQVIPPENVDPRQFREQEAQKGLAEQAQRIGCDTAVKEVGFTTESAWHEVVNYATANEVDLIVLAEAKAHGLRALLPSTAQEIAAQHPCDVLIVPAAE